MQHFLASRQMVDIPIKHLFVEYRHWIERFLIFPNWRIRWTQVNAFLTELAVSKKIAESTQNQTVVALFRLAVGLILYGVQAVIVTMMFPN